MHHFSQLEALLHLLCYKIVTMFVQTTSSPPILIPTTIHKGALLNFLTRLDHIVGWPDPRTLGYTYITYNK